MNCYPLLWRALGGAGLLLLPLLAGAEPATRTADQLVSQWVGLAQQRNQLQTDWALSEAQLQQQVTLLKAEQQALTQALAASQGERSEVDKARAQLLQEQEQMEADQQALEEQLERAYKQVRRVAPQLPPPLAAKWREPLATLGTTSLDTSERLQALLALVADFDQFNQRVALNTTAMTLSDGREIVADQVYLGVAQGWYISADDAHFGRGTASASGWQWHEQADLNPAQVRAIVATLKGEREPAIIPAPVAIAPGGDR
jgi:multidrug efflux pump subunit AcrA (membrane-fusion protein)